MRIVPPTVPSRATGKIERTLTELGHPKLPTLDEADDVLAESHRDLFEEIEAFARRGWAFGFDAEVDQGYTPELYETVLTALLRPAGIAAVELDDDAHHVIVGDRKIDAPPPEQEGDWLDLDWIMEAATRILEGSSWQLVAVEDGDLHNVVLGVVPIAVWTVLDERDLVGTWREVALDDDDDDDGSDDDVALS